ncbi:7488_t:CDS:10 [Diversispora eburnea]|uniref:7488_t:CDS:1 n=1 Tax=Diversispora eburnea TaxID=1213867 RepID=A0A9N8YSM9_9GLOM|nr:7488_t:CDS:10 [Diversispora eburnea]
MQNSSPPVALYNKSLTGYWREVYDEMKNLGWCVRFVEATQGTPGDITFPKSNITFLCFNNEQGSFCNSENNNNNYVINLANRIKRSIQRHKKSILLLYIENENMQILYTLQTKLLEICVSIEILPVHNLKETTTLLRVFYDGLLPENKPPVVQSLEKELRKKINDPTNLTTTNKWINLVAQMSVGIKKLRLHDCYILQENFSSLHNMATSTEPQLLNCSLDKETAQIIKGMAFPQIRDFLSKCNLLEYYDKFIEEGFDQLQSLLDVTESDLIAMGAKRGHRRRLQREIATLKGIPPNVPFYIQHGHGIERFTAFIIIAIASSTTEQQQNVISRSDSQKDSSYQKRKYKRHPKRDQNAPAKPHSAYVLFSQKVRSEYKIKGKNLPFQEMAKVVGDRWKTIPTHEKEELEAQASAEKEKYLVSLSRYKITENWNKYQVYLKEFKEKYESSAHDSKARKRQKMPNSHESSSNQSSGGYHADSGSREMSSGSSNYNHHVSRHSSTGSNYIPPYRHLNPSLPFFNTNNNNSNTNSTAPLRAEDEQTFADDNSSRKGKTSACGSGTSSESPNNVSSGNSDTEASTSQTFLLNSSRR